MLKGILFLGIILSSVFVAHHFTKSIITRQTLPQSVDLGPSLWDFTLIDQNNQPVDARTFLGKPALIYFGFAFCPDVCPISLEKMSKVLEELDKYNITTQGIFITVDPSRDTPQELSQYLKSFNKNIIALTGNSVDIGKVAKTFKVYYAHDDKSDPENYLINHSSFIYAMNKKGQLVRTFSFNDSAEEILNFIRINLR